MKCPMAFSKAVQKKERDFRDCYYDKNVALAQWNDYEVVYMASSFAGVKLIKAVKRFY